MAHDPDPDAEGASPPQGPPDGRVHVRVGVGRGQEVSGLPHEQPELRQDESESVFQPQRQRQSHVLQPAGPASQGGAAAKVYK